jgi:membrane protease YdiL (CAAX protease family)
MGWSFYDYVLSSSEAHPLLEDQSLLSADNQLFRLARSGRLRLPQSWLQRQPLLFDKILYPAAVILFAYLVPILSSFIGVPLLALPYVFPEIQQTVWNQFLILVGAFAPFFFLIWVWLWILERRPLWSTGMERPFLRKYLRGLVIGFLMFTAVVVLLAIFDFVITETPFTKRFSLLSIAGAMLVFLGWMVQGAAEELLARGFLLPVIGVRWGPWAGVIISALFFALLHLSNPHIDFLSILNLALFGLFAAQYALYEGSLWGIFAIHAIWNWAQGNFFGLAVSGLEINSGMLFDLMENGPDWLTGGLFGPEGGLVVTFVLLMGMLLLILVGRRRGKKLAKRYN